MVRDGGRPLRLRLSERSSTGYRGVERTSAQGLECVARFQRRGGAVTELGTFASAVVAAAAYAHAADE
eukprot:scaffold33952_cov18-Phaeocystis_antarctica.AAC.1